MTIKKGKKGFTIRISKKKLAALLTIMELYKFEKGAYFNEMQKSQTYNNFLKVLTEWN